MLAAGTNVSERRSGTMPRYFFDTRDGDVFIEDGVGEELPALEAAKAMAAMSLAELARDVLPTSERRILVVKVREEQRPSSRSAPHV